MHVSLLAAAAVAATSWKFDVRTDPLGQNVYVAEASVSTDLPQAKLQFSCGGIIGVELQFNLGQASYSGKALSNEEPAWEDVTFVFPEGPYPTTTKKAPLTDGVGTFEIKGNDAMFIARLFRSGGEVVIEHARQAARFMLQGAAGPINEVIDACPFKYAD